ncbi:hypothetical protein BJ170DRAFT_687364 [Xylariales sp. AK1849]|nr:hypothetical protein BJ170DRAFT_687364 [Xylariales sp. AK1849]
MASRSRRNQPEYDEPYNPKDEYPDPYTAANDDGFEYVGPDAIPEPPSHTFERDEPSSSRRRSPSGRRKSNRASTLPPKQSSSLSPPPRSRRAASPPAYSSKHSDSPPRQRRSRRDASPPAKLSKSSSASKARMQDRLLNKPAVKNMKTYGKTYGRKGLSTLGEVVEAYAAAQAPPPPRGRSTGRYPCDDYDDEIRDPYDRRRPRRRRYSLSPSPSPPRRSAAKHSSNRRPPLHGRQKSYSVSPTPLGRGYDSDSDRSRRNDRSQRKGSRRQSRRYSPSPSVSPPRRRARSHSRSTRSQSRRGRDSDRESTAAVPLSKRHRSMNAAKEHFKSPNPDVAHRWQFAARAALEAGGVTAFRLRKEPGSWVGDKGAKVATAAIGAAAIDAFMDKDPRRVKAGGMKGMAENVIGGMIASKVMGFKGAVNHKGKPRWDS